MAVPGDARENAPRKWVLITKVVFAVSLLLLIGWDIVVANNSWRGDTVSELTLWSVLRSLTLTFALGYISGHLTWPAKLRRPVVLVLIIGGSFLVVLLTLDVLTWSKVIDWNWLSFLRAWPPLIFLPAYVLGRLFWPQVRS